MYSRSMNLSPGFKPKVLSAMIAGILGLAHAPTYANLIDYELLAEASYQQGSNSGNDSNTGATAASAEVNPGLLSAILAGRASGTSAGWMYSTAGGEGLSYRVDSSITQSVEVSNNSAADLDYSYNFVVNFGSIQANNYGFTDTAEYSQAGYYAEILVNGIVLWSSMAELLTNLAGTTSSFSGTQWGTYVDGSEFFNWGSFSDTLDLGSLAAGSSLNLSYRISTFAAGNHLNLGCDVGGGGGGEIGLLAVEICDDGYGYGFGFSGYSYAQFGDPNSFSTSPVAFSDDNITGRAIATVPTPATGLLIGVGLAGLAFRNRRKKRSI